MKKSTIAIVIPVFNVENYVKQTLESVKNQLSQPDEVIIINDGSTDSSSKIIDEYSNFKSWMTIHQNNKGLGSTRNLGRSITKCEYTYFLDSDDIVKNDFILKMHETINKYNKPDMILFSGKSFSTSENKKTPNLKFSFDGQYFRNSKLITKLVKKRESFPQVSRYITKNLLWSKNKLDYPKGAVEDDAVFFPLLALSQNTVVLSESYYSYRVGRPGSVTSKIPDSIYAKDYLNLIKSTLWFMTKNYDLIKADIWAWNYRLERRGLKYVSMCLKTNSPISWKTMLNLFCKFKKMSFPLKLLWRILMHLLKR